MTTDIGSILKVVFVGVAWIFYFLCFAFMNLSLYMWHISCCLFFLEPNSSLSFSTPFVVLAANEFLRGILLKMAFVLLFLFTFLLFFGIV